MKPTKLRFAIMCNGTQLSYWQHQCIKELIESGVAEPVLLIQPADDSGDAEFTKRDLLTSRIKELPFRIYNRFWVKRKSRAHQKIDGSRILGQLPVMQCHTEKIGKYRERFSTKDIDTVSSQKLDFVLRFAFSIIEGDILSSSKHGVWSFHHGDNRKFGGSPPGFWECYYGQPQTGVILQRLSEKLDAGHILYRGIYESNRSYSRNFEQIFLKSCYFPVRACKAIIAGSAPPEQIKSKVKIYKPPGPLHLSVYFAKRFVRLLALLYRRLFYFDIWNVGFVDQHMEEVLKNKKLNKVDWLNLPSAHRGGLSYIADPFPYEHENVNYILVEDYTYKAAKGIISRVTLPGAFETIEKTPVLSLKEHLSYPFTFTTEDGQRYCMPELAEAGKIALFQEQPDHSYRFLKDLVTGVKALDSTYCRHEGKHWLFFTTTGNDFQLQAYYSSELNGPWLPHSLNPLKEDITCTRPAGKLIEIDNTLYRPAQDGTVTYGAAIRIMRIDKLSPTEFEETEILRLVPDKNGPFPDGLHTINSTSNGIVLDGKRFRFMWTGPIQRLLWKKAIAKRKAV